MNQPPFTYASPDRYKLLKEFARQNRKNQTPAENFFWRTIKERHFWVKFKRQFVIGDYIADFANLEARIVIEIDGAYHCEPIQIEDDKVRSAWLEKMGWHVLRFTNDEIIFDTNRVLNTIQGFYEGLQKHI